jgi:hypothetical protein
MTFLATCKSSNFNKQTLLLKLREYFIFQSLGIILSYGVWSHSASGQQSAFAFQAQKRAAGSACARVHDHFTNWKLIPAELVRKICEPLKLN